MRTMAAEREMKLRYLPQQRERRRTTTSPSWGDLTAAFGSTSVRRFGSVHLR